MVAYLPETPWVTAATWFVVAIIVMLVLSVLSAVARRVILINVDTTEEVDRQQNIGVGFVEAAIFVAIGLIINGLLA